MSVAEATGRSAGSSSRARVTGLSNSIPTTPASGSRRSRSTASRASSACPVRTTATVTSRPCAMAASWIPWIVEANP